MSNLVKKSWTDSTKEVLKNSVQKKLKSTVSDLYFNFSSQINDKNADRMTKTPTA